MKEQSNKKKPGGQGVPGGRKNYGEHKKHGADKPGGGYKKFDEGKPQGEYKKYDGNKPKGEYKKYDGNKPKGEYKKYDGDKPRGEYKKYDGDKPRGEYKKYDGDKPQGEYKKYDGSKPQNEYKKYDGNKPQGEYKKYDGNKPKGEYKKYDGNKPQGEYKKYDGDKPRGEYKKYGGSKPQGEYKKYDGNKPGDGRKKYVGDKKYEDRGRGGETGGHSEIKKQSAAAARDENYPLAEQGKTTPPDIYDGGFAAGNTLAGAPAEGAVIGRNAVRELLKSGREVDKLFVRRGDREGSIVVLIADAKSAGIPVIEVERAKLDALSGGTNHQGVVAMAAEKEYCSIEDIIETAAERGESPLIVIADGITDPYNLGALIRCAEGAGAHGLIIPKRRASGLTPLVNRASAGALEHLAVAKVPNIAAAVAALKERGIWIFAAEVGGKNYYESDFSGPCAIVLGSEGEGISRVVLESCDFRVAIPMYGKVNSLNVSSAAAVILAEASRQHRAIKK